jgi:transcriptional regulator with XRE-family HTH domain
MISDNIRNARLAAGLTQQQLAEQLGITQPMILHIEKRRKIPNAILLGDIASILGTTTDSLIYGGSPRKWGVMGQNE